MEIGGVLHWRVGKHSWNSVVVGSRLQSPVYRSERSIGRRKYQSAETLINFTILLDAALLAGCWIYRPFPASSWHFQQYRALCISADFVNLQ